MDLHDSNREINTGALSEVALMLHCSWLKKLPREILEMIRDLSPDSVLWRYASVISLRNQISETRSGDLVPEKISEICFWERGTRPQRMSHRTTSRVVRLSIDLRGIQSIECTTDCPYTKNRSECFAFIVEDAKQLQDVIGEFKVVLNSISISFAYPIYRTASYV